MTPQRKSSQGVTDEALADLEPEMLWRQAEARYYARKKAEREAVERIKAEREERQRRQKRAAQDQAIALAAERVREWAKHVQLQLACYEHAQAVDPVCQLRRHAATKPALFRVFVFVGAALRRTVWV